MSCQLFRQLKDAINEAVAEYTMTAKTYKPSDLGLDDRCAYSLYVQDGCIIVFKTNDKDLQYYGGFEYIEPEHRLELGNYVLYSSDSNRVKDHIQNLTTEH